MLKLNKQNQQRQTNALAKSDPEKHNKCIDISAHY